ncbi:MULTISPECIES: hypothetical protein [unclassified Corallococcus]|uniref:hypothetical protein n=1 Tax=unclassified Corallococcus TaxID=2685029 RepID=UPI001A8DE694|nr:MULTISPECIES: hypothetical protein [unclassified Corallococcus]MBN9685723.1 hypothetical protein [Corallococcus sp. NCSPR001]WAS82832.1 hypothetical protein O0N60_26330 [Corallococcus sp. NCRR]
MRYLLLLIPLLSGCASSPRTEAPRLSDADRIVQELCGKQMALLGEESHHGSARTVAFKAELTRRLVEECGYDAFFIETASYDFLRIQALLKAGQPVSDDMLATAIGGMWSSPEMAPLIPFLAGGLRAGSLVVGGIDDQINGGTWATKEMTRELSARVDIVGVGVLQTRSTRDPGATADGSQSGAALHPGGLRASPGAGAARWVPRRP